MISNEYIEARIEELERRLAEIEGSDAYADEVRHGEKIIGSIIDRCGKALRDGNLTAPKYAVLNERDWMCVDANIRRKATHLPRSHMAGITLHAPAGPLTLVAAHGSFEPLICWAHAMKVSDV